MKININTILIIFALLFVAWFMFSKKTAVTGMQTNLTPVSAGDNIMPKEDPVPVGVNTVKETIIKYLPWQPKPVKSVYASSATGQNWTKVGQVQSTQ